MPTANDTPLYILEKWREAGPRRDFSIFTNHRRRRNRYTVELWIADGDLNYARGATMDEAIRKALEAANANR